MSNQIFHFSNTGISSGQRFYLKDDVSGIFVRNLKVDSNFPVVASNLVYNTGNQTIGGVKSFRSGNFDDLTLNYSDIGNPKIKFGRDDWYLTVDNGDPIYTLGGNTPIVLNATYGQISSNGLMFELTSNDLYINYGLDGNYAQIKFDKKLIRFNDPDKFTDYYFKSGVTGDIPIDSEVVHNTGNETINGSKVFTSQIIAPNLVYNTGNQNIFGTKSFISNTFFDKDIIVSGNIRASGTSYFNDNLNVVNTLNVSGNLNINGSLSAPNVVLTRGRQTISGVKTFTNELNLNAYTGNGYDNTNNEFRLNIGGDTNENAGIQIDAYGTNPPQILMRRARGIPTGLSGVLKDDVLFNLQARGYVSGLNNYSTNSRAAIRLIAAEDWVGGGGYNNQGTYILFRTTNTGTSSAINKVIIGTSGINLLDGNIYISGNAVLTGTIPTAQIISNVVYTTGDQTISGNKTFSSPIYFASGITNTNIGGAGGIIDLRGGNGGIDNPGSPGGSITLRGVSDRSAGIFSAGSIDLSAINDSAGGSITSRGGGQEGTSGGSLDMSGGPNSISGPGGSINTSNRGGSINTAGADERSGGSINTSASAASNGGNINTSNGGGSINTSDNGGSIDLSGSNEYSTSGGSITAVAYQENPAGSLDMSAVSGGSGGSINTSAGNAGNGGSINTSNYGGSISLQGDSTGYSGGSITAIGADGANAGSLNMSAGNGGSGGSINTSAGLEGPGGSIDTSGSDDDPSAGGSINTSAGAAAPGGSINTSGGEYSGGSINTSDGGGSISTAGDGSVAGLGGSINTSQGGGSIDTSNGGGSINTRGKGFIEFGSALTRTILSGNYQGDGDPIKVILPNTNGTLALNSNVANTGSILDNKINSLSGVSVLTFGNQTISGRKTFFDSGVFSNGGVPAVPLLNNPLSIVGSGNSYLQLNIQNRATGTDASADLVITANNGTDNSNFINLGINNSGYNNAAYTNGNGYDGYLFIDGGNLDIGTRTPNTSVEFHAGGTTAANTIARITQSGLNLVSGNLTVGNTPVLLSGSIPFTMNFGHIKNNTNAGNFRYYFGPQMDIGPATIGNNEKRRTQILQDCFLRNIAWSAFANTNIPTPSNAITGYFKNFGNNPLGNDTSVGVQVTQSINIPSTNIIYNYSTGNLNVPIKSGDYVSFYYQTNFDAGSNNLASGLVMNLNAYFYV